MTYYWLTDPELFLYVKGTSPDDVHLWRCKKPASSSSSSLVVPMKSDDFNYVSNVKNHMELIGNFFDWDETDYKRLVKYIFERRLLVNSHGFVIAELHKDDKDGNKTIDNANEEVPFYIRSLDILPLKPYIPKLRERPIPSRTVKYLGDVNGKAAMMEEDCNVTKLTARVVDLESKNKTLDTNVTKLKADLAKTTCNVSDLQSKNKTLEAVNKTLEGKVTKLIVDLFLQMNELPTRVWMNKILSSEWVGLEGLTDMGSYDNLIIVGSLGTFTVDDSSTNVQARYWYKIKSSVSGKNDYKAVLVEDLTPNKERARFSPDKWSSCKSKGKTYVYMLGCITKLRPLWWFR